MPPRKEFHSDDVRIDQRADIVGDENIRPDEVIKADPSIIHKEYLEELAFNEEPVTIRLEGSSDPNAASAIPIWVNGKGCEVFIGGKWIEMMFIPVGVVLIVKRKYLGVLIAAKQDKVTTDFGNTLEKDPVNRVKRFTSAYQSFSILEDKNPKGAAWATEMMRRNR